MGEKPDISEQVQLAFVGLIGANNEIEKVLKDFHERYDRPSNGFLFYEFLLHQPLDKMKNLNNEVSKTELNKRWKNTWIFSPFPYRLARKSLLMIPPAKASELIEEIPRIIKSEISSKEKKSKYLTK